MIICLFSGYNSTNGTGRSITCYLELISIYGFRRFLLRRDQLTLNQAEGAEPTPRRRPYVFNQTLNKHGLVSQLRQRTLVKVIVTRVTVSRITVQSTSTVDPSK